jgi:aminoglycoside/choline kinase family phosphotransferase
MAIPLTVDEINKTWLNSVLAEAGFPDNEIDEVRLNIIGEGSGFMGDVIRLTVSFDGIDANESVIVKIPTASDNRKVGQSLGVYEREIRFYEEFRNRMPVRTPAYRYGAMDEAIAPEKTLAVLRFINRLPGWLMWSVFRLATWFGGKAELRYVLMIEDLGHLRVGDQVAGCTAADAKMTLAAMAKMQGEFWQSEVLDETPWIIPLELSIKLSQLVFREAMPDYLEQNREHLSEKDILLLQWLNDNGIALMKRLAGEPHTLVHGDFRLDNLFFDDKTSEIVLCDWQTLLSGPLGLDLAYFLSASLAQESEDSLDDLLAFYRGELGKAGIDISAKKLRWHYEASMLMILLRVIPAEFQNLIDLGDARGHDLVVTWLQRTFSKLRDVDLEQILDP